MNRLVMVAVCLAITFAIGYGAKHEAGEMMCCKHEGGEMGHALMMLDLSEAQTEQIEQIEMKAEKNMIAVRADIDIKTLDLEKEMMEENPNRAKIMQIVKDIHGLELKIKQAWVDQHLQIHALLTPEQRAQMKGAMHKCKCMGMMMGGGEHKIMIMKEHCAGCQGRKEAGVKCEQHKAQ